MCVWWRPDTVLQKPATQMPVCFEIFVLDSSAKHEKHVVTWEQMRCLLGKPGCRQPQAVTSSLQPISLLAADGLSVKVWGESWLKERNENVVTWTCNDLWSSPPQHCTRPPLEWSEELQHCLIPQFRHQWRTPTCSMRYSSSSTLFIKSVSHALFFTTF